MDVLTIVFTSAWIWFGVICMTASVAGHKGYGASTGVLIGLLYGVIGLLYFLALPDLKARQLLEQQAQLQQQQAHLIDSLGRLQAGHYEKVQGGNRE